MPIDFQKLASLRFDLAAQNAYAVLDKVQHIKPAEQQVAAVLLVALVMAEELGVRLPDALTTLDNLSRDSQRHRLPNIAAMHDYWRREVVPSVAA